MNILRTLGFRDMVRARRVSLASDRRKYHALPFGDRLWWESRPKAASAWRVEDGRPRSVRAAGSAPSDACVMIEHLQRSATS
jgi:hypothetical protein